jgi:hypothetical protein
MTTDHTWGMIHSFKFTHVSSGSPPPLPKSLLDTQSSGTVKFTPSSRVYIEGREMATDEVTTVFGWVKCVVCAVPHLWSWIQESSASLRLGASLGRGIPLLVMGCVKTTESSVPWDLRGGSWKL